MNPAVNLSGAARIAIILALIFAAVLIIHLIAGSRKLEGRAAYVALCCLAVLCLSGGALLFLSEGSPDPVQIEGFEPFGPEDLSAAASLMEETVSLQYTDGVSEGRAGVAYFDLIFKDGSFDRMALSAEYAALNPDENGEYADWRQAVVVDAEGYIHREERGEPAEGLETVPADARETVLTALERAGLKVPAKCRAGGCGFCHSKLVSGSFSVAGADKRRIADKKFGYIHPCCSYPDSDMELIVPKA